MKLLRSRGSPCCAGAPGPTRPMNDSERLPRFPGQNPRQTADRDGAKDGTTSGSARVGRDPILEMECVICTEMRPYTSFMSTTGEDSFYCENDVAKYRIFE